MNKMMEMVKIVNMIFRQGSNMLFHVTYRSYSDGRTKDDLSKNCSFPNRDDVRKCSIQSLVFEINVVYALFKEKVDGYSKELDILSIQNLLLSGNYHLSPLCLVRSDDEFPRSNSIPMFLFDFTSLADHLVMCSLGGILIQELNHSSYFRKSCYSAYNSSDRSYIHYINTIQEWVEMEALLILNCGKSITYFSRSRLIEKIRPIVNNDDNLVKLISSFTDLHVVDNKGRYLLSLKAGIPYIPFISEILFDIIMDDIDQTIEERLPKLKYARFLNEIFIPIFNKVNNIELYAALNDIFKECNLTSPDIEHAVRGGDPIPFSGGTIKINYNEGKSEIKWVV